MARLQRKSRLARNKQGPGKFIGLTVALFFMVVALAVCGGVGWVLSVSASAPNLSQLKPAKKGAISTVYAADGSKLGTITYDVLRIPLSQEAMPKLMRRATIAVEDKRFFHHGGVDYEGVIRAAIKNVTTGKTVQGGSTLEMQLIRNLYGQSDKKTIERKIIEAKLAQQLEKQHPGRKGKYWIISTYLNDVPYGTVNGKEAIGIVAAARVYFNKKPSQLTLPEAALLAGLPQAPSQYNPFLHGKAARTRRNDVLQRMSDQHYITQAEANDAMKTKLGVTANGYFKKRHEAYFFDYVKQQLINEYGLARVRQGGMKVYTTINLKLQRVARNAIHNRLSAPGDPAAALVSINPKNGHIVAMASSSKYSQSKFNLASQGKRQPGSTFKVMTLMTAIRQGVDINKTTYDSKPLDFFDSGTGTQIKVTTDDHSYGGKTTLFEGLVKSDNTVYQQLDLDMGPKNVTRTAHDMGITSHLDSYPAEGLGGLTYGVTPLEMTRAYTTINTGGYRLKPVAITKVTFPGGRVDTKIGKPDRKKIFTDGQAAEARSAMEANIQRGTGTAAQIDCPAAGKTGTTSAFTDAWFDGFTPNLNTAVWVGYPKATISMTDVPGYGTMFGGDAPAEIWHDFMETATAGNCGEWAPIKEPFVSQPFFGKYATTGAPGGGDDPNGTFSDGNGGDTGSGKDTGGKDTGGTTYDSGKYAAPPQGKPDVKPQKAPPPVQKVPDTKGDSTGGTGN
jgi:penicillin-binding protein 1A